MPFNNRELNAIAGVALQVYDYEDQKKKRKGQERKFQTCSPLSDRTPLLLWFIFSVLSRLLESDYRPPN